MDIMIARTNLMAACFKEGSTLESSSFVYCKNKEGELNEAITSLMNIKVENNAIAIEIYLRRIIIIGVFQFLIGFHLF